MEPVLDTPNPATPESSDSPSSQTLCVIRVFSDLYKPEKSPEVLQTMLPSLAQELHALAAPWQGEVLETEGNGLVLAFSSPSTGPRTDTLNACRAIPTLIQQLSAFRLTRPAEEQTYYHFGASIVTASKETGDFEAAREHAFEWAFSLASMSQPEQILTEQLTFQELSQELPSGWKTIETEADFGNESQQIYSKSASSRELPAPLRRKCYVVTPDASGSHPDSLCLYYTHSLVLPNAPTPLPILRLYVASSSEESTTASTTATPETGGGETKIGRFTLLSVLGVGGMGQVWKAKDNFGNLVALKMMLPGNAAVEGQLARFRREAEIMSKLPHHNICRIFEVGEANSICYIAMELVQGISLHDLLHYPINDGLAETQSRRSAPTLAETIKQILALKALPKVEGAKRKSINRILPVPQTIGLLNKICDALQFAHDHNILHRDLKPANIMLREDGEPVVMDFGLGKLETDDHDKDLSLTMSGAMLGTVQYMSPEQALSSKDVDGRADVYSIGAILYEMLTGHHHFTVTGNLLKDAQALQDHEPSRPSTHNNILESDLEVVVLKSLHPEAERRYRSPSALSDDLDRYRHGEAITAKPVTLRDVARRFYKRNRPAAIATFISAGVLVGGAIGGGIYLNQARIEAVNAKQNAEIQKNEAVAALKQAEVSERKAVEAKQKADEALALAEEQKQKAIEAGDDALREKRRAQAALADLNVASGKLSQAEANAEQAKRDAEDLKKEKQLAELKNQEFEQQQKERDRKRRAMAQSDPNRLSREDYQRISQNLTQGLSRIFRPHDLNFAVDECNKILNSSPEHVGVLLAVSKLALADDNLPTSLDALEKIAKIKETDFNRDDKMLATQFSDMLASHMEAKPDFFDNKAKDDAVMKRSAIFDAWREMGSADQSFARYMRKSGALSFNDKQAIIKFFKSRESH